MSNHLKILVLIFIAPLSCQAQPEPTGRRLRDIMEEKFPNREFILGGTTGAWTFGQQTSLIMDREFNYVTPENDFKQWNVHGDNSANYNWVQTDAWMEHIEENGQILRMHGPIGPQCSTWTKEDNRTAEELEENLIAFLTASCQRYNGVSGVVSMDVVNETIIDGQWHGPITGTDNWENPWTIIGSDTDANQTPLYIKMAFEIANEHAPDLKLIFNHHEHPESTASWNLIKETILYLRDNGLRVDGIGWQAHVDNGWASQSNLDRLADLIDWAHENDLEFHVTEASVWMSGPPNASDLESQAETYTKIIEVLLDKRENGIIGWNTWHIDDGTGWRTDEFPSIFDSDGVAKPAYYAIQELLETFDLPPASINDLGNVKATVFPNPLTSTSVLNLELPSSSFVHITWINALGQVEDDLMLDKVHPGNHQISLGDLLTDNGQLYFVRIMTKDFSKVVKLVKSH